MSGQSKALQESIASKYLNICKLCELVVHTVTPQYGGNPLSERQRTFARGLPEVAKVTERNPKFRATDELTGKFELEADTSNVDLVTFDWRLMLM